MATANMIPFTVKCIDATCSVGALECDKHYEVIQFNVNEDVFYLKGVLGGWNTTRFEIVSVPPKDDPIHLPNHYARYKIEPIRFITENELPFWMGNVIKYTMRYDAKNGVEDLKKARRYLDMQIELLEGNEEWWK